jgi:DNA polymerase III delta subunit
LIRKSGHSEQQGADSIILVYAADPRFMDEERAQFSAKWGKESEITRIPGTVGAGELTNFFQSRGIFETVTVLHLWQGEKMSKEASQTLLDFCRKPVGGVAILIEYAGDLSDRNRKLDKTWREMAGVLNPVNANPSSAKGYILKRLKNEAVRIDDEAMESLEMWTNKELSLLPSALDLLCLAAMETRNITSKDVADLLGAGGSPNIFALQECFLQKDPEGIISSVKKIENDEDSAPLAFVTVLSRQLHLMMKLHSVLSEGGFLDDITPEQVEKSLQPWQFGRLKQSHAKWPPDETFTAMIALAQLDKALKGDAGEPWAAVERHLLLILNGISGMNS